MRIRSFTYSASESKNFIARIIISWIWHLLPTQYTWPHVVKPCVMTHSGNMITCESMWHQMGMCGFIDFIWSSPYSQCTRRWVCLRQLGCLLYPLENMQYAQRRVHHPGLHIEPRFVSYPSGFWNPDVVLTSSKGCVKHWGKLVHYHILLLLYIFCYSSI